MGMFFCDRDWETSQDRAFLGDKLFLSAQDLGLGQRITFEQDNNLKQTAKKKHRSGFRKTVKVLEWLSQSGPEPIRASLEKPQNGCAPTLWCTDAR